MKTITKKNSLTEQELFELTQAEMQDAAGGAYSKTQGIVDLIFWARCGFNHHYIPTGKRKQDVDLIFPITLYQLRCRDCGYTTWKRDMHPEIVVNGPKIDPNAMPHN